MRSSKHYAWLLRGRFLRLLEGIAESSISALEVKARTWTIGCGATVTLTNWQVSNPYMGYITVCLRGNSKQRRQQRRAVKRFLDDYQATIKLTR